MQFLCNKFRISEDLVGFTFIMEISRIFEYVYETWNIGQADIKGAEQQEIE